VPSLTRIGASLAAGVVTGLVFLLWIGWPGFLAVGAGAVFGIAFLIVATGLGDDPRVADEAWRAQAPDLLGAARQADRIDPDGGSAETDRPAASAPEPRP
jgi:hypothetical protein